MMDQLQVRVDAGRTKEPRTKRELIYGKTGAQRGTNQTPWESAHLCYRQAVMTVAHRRHKRDHLSEKEHRATSSSYATGFLHAASQESRHGSEELPAIKGRPPLEYHVGSAAEPLRNDRQCLCLAVLTHQLLMPGLRLVTLA